MLLELGHSLVGSANRDGEAFFGIIEPDRQAKVNEEVSWRRAGPRDEPGFVLEVWCPGLARRVIAVWEHRSVHKYVQNTHVSIRKGKTISWGVKGKGAANMPVSNVLMVQKLKSLVCLQCQLLTCGTHDPQHTSKI